MRVRVLVACALGIGLVGCAQILGIEDGDRGAAGGGVAGAGGSGAGGSGGRLAPWARAFGTAGTEVCRAMAVSPSGDIYLGGSFGGPALDFGDQVLTASDAADVYVAKLRPDGSTAWSQSYGGQGYQLAEGIAVHTDGTVAVAGTFAGALDFGMGPLTSLGPSGFFGDIFVAKLDAEGNGIWSSRFGDGAADVAYDVAVGPTGEVVLVGAIEGAVDFGGGALVSAGGFDIFVASLSSGGEYLWAHRFGDNGVFQSALGVAVDTDGSVVVVGAFDGALDFDGNVHASAGELDIFVAKFDDQGARIWSERYGGLGTDFAEAVTIADGNIYVVGQCGSNCDLGFGPYGADANGFLLKLSADGIPQWQEFVGENDGDFQTLQGVAVHPEHGVVAVGSASGTFTMGGQSFRAMGGSDVVALSITEGGDVTASIVFGSAGDDAGLRGDFAGGRLVLAGAFQGELNAFETSLSHAGGGDVFVGAVPLD